MEIKNRKMNALIIIWTLISSLLILVLFQALKRINDMLQEMSKRITSLSEDIIGTKTDFSKHLDEHYELLHHLKRIYIIFDILKISSPLAIRLTLNDIITSKETPSIQKMNIVLLKNLIEEYNTNIKELKQRIEKSDDHIEKEKIGNIIEEFRNMITLISTVSEESSQEYVEQIYHEIFSSVKKIRGV